LYFNYIAKRRRNALTQQEPTYFVALAPYARQVHLTGDFNSWHPHSLPMEPLAEGLWYAGLSLEPGRYRYQFVADGLIPLVDPMATSQLVDEQGNLISLIEIDHLGNRCHPRDKLIPRLIRAFLTAKQTSILDQRSFKGTAENIICSLVFNQVCEEPHTVSVLWFTPDNNLYYCSRNSIWRPHTYKEETVTVQSWIYLKDRQLPPGRWTVYILLNGVPLQAENFTLLPHLYQIDNGKPVIK
jgi:hypothetical protein